MPDILPPQLVGVQQRSLYVKARTVLTVISCVWLLMAITGIGFFSGGTTSLAFSLILLYGTGMALIVVIAAIYRFTQKYLLRRAERTQEHTAAVALVDTARSATQEFRAALRPPAATGQYAPAVRNVGPGVPMTDAVAAARRAAVAESVAQAVAAAQAAAVRPPIQENPEPAKPQQSKSQQRKSQQKSPQQSKSQQKSRGQKANGSGASESKESAATRPRLVLASSSAPQDVQKVRPAPGCQKAS